MSHAKLSPSKRHRWSACPGSVREEARYPEQPSGAAAIDGTHTHTLLSKCIDTKIAPVAFVGQTLDDHEGTFVVDATRAERVQFALDIIGTESHSEMRVDPARYVERQDMSGTIDAWRVSRGNDKIALDVWLYDYKDGMAYVPAEGNKQLEQYAVGVAAKLADAGEVICADTNWHMVIIQPKLREKGMQGYEVWTVKTPHIQGLVDTLKREGAACDDPNASMVPGEHCKYCAHKGACTSLLGKVSEAFPDLTVKEVTAPSATMSDQQLRNVLEMAPLVNQLIEAAQDEAKRRMESGHPVAGLKLVRGRGSRAWAYSDDEMAAKLSKMGLPKDSIWETKLISPAKAEKARWKKRDGEEKQLSEKQLKLLDSEYIKKTEGALTVALETDRRPAVTISAAEFFLPTDIELPDFLKPLPV